MPGDEQNMRVIVRVRPQPELSTSTENLAKDKGDLESSIDGNNKQAITIDSSESKISIYRERKGESAFSFSNVLDTTADQESLYKLCKDSINDVMGGINCSILAYGQTGSGKTYSMLGKGIEEGAMTGLGITRDLSSTGLVDDDTVTAASTTQSLSAQAQLASEFVGIVPRCISDMFTWIEKQREVDAANNSSLDYSITANYLQIYNEKLFDLLQDRQLKHPLHLRDAEKGAYSSVYVQGLSEYRVRSKDEVLSLLLKGLRNRATRATEMNNESSRSHTILQLFVQVHGFDASTGLPVLKRSTFSFVDLAGSEKWRAGLTQAGNSQLDVQKEMTNINTSLHALGNCVSALIEPGRKHIPYRDSLLTRLLRDSLGGQGDGGARGKSVLIATIREDESMLDETYSTLQFASRASKIKTILKPAASDYLQFQSTGNMTLEKAKKEISLLREHINHLEGAQLKKIEQANNPAMNAPAVHPTYSDNSGRVDITALCDQITALLSHDKQRASGEEDDMTNCSQCTIYAKVLKQCEVQIKELYSLWSVANSKSSGPSDHDSGGGGGGYGSDNSQSSLTKQTVPAVPKTKKKTKKSATVGQPPKPQPHASPTKQRMHEENSGALSLTKQATLAKAKRKAVSASAAIVEKPKKSTMGKKEKEGISLPLLKSNSAGTYAKQGHSRVAHATGITRPAQIKEDIYRQKKGTKKKKNLDGLTSMSKLRAPKKTNQATHNNRYKDNAEDGLEDDLLGIIHDESDGEDTCPSRDSTGAVWQGSAGSDEEVYVDDENDEEIMRRIEMENMKIIQAEDLARERKRQQQQQQHLQHPQQEHTARTRSSHSRSRDSRLLPQQDSQIYSEAPGGSNTNTHSIENILAASRNAVLAANGALSTLSPRRHQQPMPDTGPSPGHLQHGRSPARQSVEEEHRLSIHEIDQQQQQHQQQQSMYPSQQVMAPSPSQHQSSMDVAGSYSITTSYSKFNSGMLAMPPSSIDTGAGGFGSKCRKHGLESCVLCTMFNTGGGAPSVTAAPQPSTYTTGGTGGVPTPSNLSRSIHSPIKSGEESGRIGGGESSTPGTYGAAPSTTMVNVLSNTGFCSIHHVNDCLLCSLTAQKRGGSSNPSPSHHMSSSPSRQAASSGIPAPHQNHAIPTPQSITAGSPGIGFSQNNSSLVGNTAAGNTTTPRGQANTLNTPIPSGLNSMGGPNSNTTAPGMFTASPNRQHNFNSYTYNNSTSLASQDGVYAFGKNTATTSGGGHNSTVVAANHVPSAVPSSSGRPGSGGGSFRSRYPVKSNPISEEGEHDAGSTHSSRHSVGFYSKQQFQQVAQGGASPHRSTSGSASNDRPYMSNSGQTPTTTTSTDENRRSSSSAAEFEALLQSMTSSQQMKTEAIPSKYAKLPAGGGIQFEDDTDDVGTTPVPPPNAGGGGGGGGGMVVRTDHRRGHAINRNAQSGLYEYDYRSKVEYQSEESNSALTKSNTNADSGGGGSARSSGGGSGTSSTTKQLSGAAASAASVYGNDMSKLVSGGAKNPNPNPKAKKKQMNRKLFEMQKNKQNK